MTTTRPVTLTRVLCPTDFSEFSSTALDYAAALALSYGSTLRLVHVITPFPITGPYLDLPGGGPLYEAAADQARTSLAAEAGRVSRTGVRIETELREGTAVQEILTAAAEWPADLIVMGTHGRGGFERLVLGSVAEKVLRKAPCAVLAVPHDAIAGVRTTGAQINHVLCPHDGSSASALGVAHAVSLAERTGAKLTLMSVVEALPDGDTFTGPGYAAYREAREAHARQALDTAVTPEVRVACNVRDRLVFGHPAQQILEVAAQERPDVVVMGIHGRGALDLLMFGSTTNHVVRHAPCPVLTVRQAPAA